MIVIPAIDIKDGRCVRLRQGRMDDVTVFGEDPAAVARHWFDADCRRLHLVDLDGAVAGAPRNAELVGRIASAAGEVPVQIGGGIRDYAAIEAYLEVGISQVIIGTRAVEDPEFLRQACERFPGRVILGLDARAGQIATDGWEATSGRAALDFARWAGALELFAIVYTDIERDGMLTGVNVPATLEVADAAGLPVIASGGVANLEDVARLKAAAPARGGLMGFVTGRALYEGTLEFRAAQQLLDA